MTVERVIRVVAGSMILISLLLGAAASPIFYSDKFLWLTTFVGLNLLQSGFTNFCLLETILNKISCCETKKT